MNPDLTGDWLVTRAVTEKGTGSTRGIRRDLNSHVRFAVNPEPVVVMILSESFRVTQYCRFLNWILTTQDYIDVGDSLCCWHFKDLWQRFFAIVLRCWRPILHIEKSVKLTNKIINLTILQSTLKTVTTITFSPTALSFITLDWNYNLILDEV